MILIQKHIIGAHLCGVQAHFAVAAWFYSAVGVRLQGMLSLQDGSHKDCLLVVRQTTMRQRYDIFAKRQREWGKFFEGGGRV